MLAGRFGFVWITLLVSVGTVAAENASRVANAYLYPPPGEFTPYFSLAAGFSSRLDERESVDDAPVLRMRLHYHVRPSVLFHAGLGYNYLSEWGFGNRFRSVEGELGFRIQSPGTLVSPFLELGLSVARYLGDDAWTGLSETRCGAALAVGAALRIAAAVNVDISLRHVANSRTTDHRFVAELGHGFTPPPPDGWIWTPASRFDGAVFDPTTLEVLLNVRL